MVRALAARTDGVVVVTDRVLRHDLPGNVTFRTFGSATRAGRTIGYLRAVGGALRDRPDALVAHMVPLYVVLAAPFAKPRGIPMLLWYTHWRSDWSLRTATRLCAAALTVDRASYPVDSPKVRAIGHGIDLARFPPREGDRAAGAAAAGRARPDPAVEGAADAARRLRAGSCPGARRRARDPRAAAHRRGAGAPRRAGGDDRREPGAAGRARASRTRRAATRSRRCCARPMRWSAPPKEGTARRRSTRSSTRRRPPRCR